jgi:chromate transporter
MIPEGDVLKKIVQLFVSSFLISAMTFGGGYVIAAFMKKKFVDELRWIDQTEMLDMIALAQAAPGPIAVNTSVLVGWKIAGLWGMMAAVLGTVLPCFLILVLVALFYDAFMEQAWAQALMQGMQAAMAAIMTQTVLDMLAPNAKGFKLFLMLAAFAASWFVNVIWIVLAGLLIGGVRAWRLSHSS